MSRRFLVSAALLLASAVVAGPVLAQGQDEQGQGQRQRGQRGQRGGFGGFGGFGGMGGGGSMALLNSEQVQNEIELIDEQKTEIEAAQTAMREELQGLFQGGAGGEEETDEERQARFTEGREKMEALTKSLQEKIENEILLPPQVERLKQINIQVRGIASLNDEEVATALSMTDDQKAELTAIQEEMRTQMTALFPGFGQRGQGGDGGQPRPQQTDEERQAARDKMTALRAETEAKQMAVLTEAQSAQFEAMKGEPVSFDIAELQGGRGGRGGFGGGGRGGRGRGGNDGAQQPEQN